MGYLDTKKGEMFIKLFFLNKKSATKGHYAVSLNQYAEGNNDLIVQKFISDGILVEVEKVMVGVKNKFYKFDEKRFYEVLHNEPIFRGLYSIIYQNVRKNSIVTNNLGDDITKGNEDEQWLEDCKNGKNF